MKRTDKSRRKPFSTSPVVAVNPDGTVAGYFERISDAGEKYGIPAQCISRSCKGGMLCRGLQWWYEEDFRVAWQERKEELAYERNPDYTILGNRLKKGHKMGNTWVKMDEQTRERVRRQRSERAKRRALAKENRFGANAPKRYVEVRCVETGVVYPSLSEAARQTGISLSMVHKSVHTGYAAKGRHFEQVRIYSSSGSVM